MDVTFVGTGSGKTQLHRFHTSILFKSKNHNLLIDTGDGISRALLSSKIFPNEIDSIFITHTHSDHFSGIASLLTQMKMSNRIKPLKIYIHSSLADFAKTFLVSSFIFPDTFNFDFIIIGYDFKNELKISDDFYIKPLQNTHINNKHQINDIPDSMFVSASILIKNNGTTIHYTSDIGSIFDLSLFNEFNPNYLIVESTHIPLNEIIKFVNYSDIEETYLVHINDEDNIKEDYSKLSNKIKEKVILTIDGMRVTMT